MTGKELFGFFVRLIGLLVILYAAYEVLNYLSNTISSIVAGTNPVTTDMFINAYTVSFVVEGVGGLALLQWAEWIVRFTYPVKSKGEVCAKCGYDIRATPDRCPECGTVPVKKEKISA